MEVDPRPRLPGDVLRMIFEALLEPRNSCFHMFAEEKRRRREARELRLVDKSTSIVAERMLYRRIVLED